MRPPSNNGRRNAGWKFQLSLPPANSPDSALLAVPKPAVREMRGRKAARAAPMLALAAISRFSAASTSGRWSSTLQATPQQDR
jgi:macrolide transport system ATP-binding/permease protein